MLKLLAMEFLLPIETQWGYILYMNFTEVAGFQGLSLFSLGLPFLPLKAYIATPQIASPHHRIGAKSVNKSRRRQVVFLT